MTLVGFTDIGERGARGKRGDCVQLSVDDCMRLIQRFDSEQVAPVPAADINLVERTDVIDQAAAQFVPAPQLAVAVNRRVDFPRTAQVPGRNAVVEVVDGYVVPADLCRCQRSPSQYSTTQSSIHLRGSK